MSAGTIYIEIELDNGCFCALGTGKGLVDSEVCQEILGKDYAKFAKAFPKLGPSSMKTKTHNHAVSARDKKKSFPLWQRLISKINSR